MPRTSSIPSPARGSTWAFATSRRWPNSVVDAARVGLDVGGPDVLERYERWRRFDTLTMAAATDGLNRLFSNDAGPIRTVRDIGLGVVDRMPGLKRLFIRAGGGPRRRGAAAAARRGDLIAPRAPRLADRGAPWPGLSRPSLS